MGKISKISLFLISRLALSFSCQVWSSKFQFKQGSMNLSNRTGKIEIGSKGIGTNVLPIQTGTKWCGSGNIAENYDDLGSERAIDMCCREHDHCEDFISAGETKYNLTNEAFYTRLSCKCDEIFRRCLRATKKRTASNIGTVYFNLLNTQCFKNDYLVTGCTKKGGWLKQKCLQYDYDTNSTKFYQWFDVQKY